MAQEVEHLPSKCEASPYYVDQACLKLKLMYPSDPPTSDFQIAGTLACTTSPSLCTHFH
jgi:hypothetical protein